MTGLCEGRVFATNHRRYTGKPGLAEGAGRAQVQLEKKLGKSAVRHRTYGAEIPESELFMTQRQGHDAQLTSREYRRKSRRGMKRAAQEQILDPGLQGGELDGV